MSPTQQQTVQGITAHTQTPSALAFSIASSHDLSDKKKHPQRRKWVSFRKHQGK